jgi:hypothetical protein
MRWSRGSLSCTPSVDPMSGGHVDPPWNP